MSKVSVKTRTVRSMERERQIDFESRGAARLVVVDPEASRAIIEDIGKGRRTWGPQAIRIQASNGSGPSEHDGETVAVGEISGWPLDPRMYKADGSLVENPANGNGENVGNGHIDGVFRGMDFRGMVPGGIPAVRVTPIPENIPQSLNIP